VQMRPPYELTTLYITVRSSEKSSAAVAAVRRELQQLDPTLPISQVRTLDEIVSAAQSRPRFLTVLLTSFSSLALLLAATGIYGVISYSVSRRTREFGLRMAVGAQRSDVVELVLKRGIRLAALGIVLGLAAAFGLTRFLSAMLFGIAPTDSATFLVTPILLIAIALLACWLPARRAARVDPMVALRHE